MMIFSLLRWGIVSDPDFIFPIPRSCYVCWKWKYDHLLSATLHSVIVLQQSILFLMRFCRRTKDLNLSLYERSSCNYFAELSLVWSPIGEGNIFSSVDLYIFCNHSFLCQLLSISAKIKIFFWIECHQWDLMLFPCNTLIFTRTNGE